MDNDKIIKIKQPLKVKIARYDLFIPLIVMALAIFGVVMVFSSSYYVAIKEFGTPYYYLKRQIIWVLAGVFCMILFAIIDYHLLLKLWWIAYIIGLGLLGIVLIPGLGHEALGATRWISIAGITIMPGEISKACIVFFITGFLSRKPERINSFFKGVMVICVAAGIYAGLIMGQPNMSTAFTMLLIAFFMMFAAKAKISHLSFIGLGGLAAGISLIVIDEDGYRYGRLLSYLHPFDDVTGIGWNAVQSLVALGTGGFKGKGLGNSVQKNLYLPMPHNDFILAVIGEELGFLGIAVLMLVYFLLIFRSTRVALRAKDLEGKLLATGITAWIGIQTIIHFAVVTVSMPPTGVILPYISYGGNAMLLFMMAAGILMNISKQSK